MRKQTRLLFWGAFWVLMLLTFILLQQNRPG